MNIYPSEGQLIQLNNFETKLDCDGIDEESNNGPLDFSLHRTIVGPDVILKNSNRGKRFESHAGKSRVKLTARETSEQRSRRLEKGRERMRKLRANETIDERTIRLLKARECQERRRKRERELETPEEREERLAVARNRTRTRRHEESPAQREKRLRSTRERLRLKRMSESSEERLNRLNSQKEKKSQKYNYVTSEEKDVYRSRNPKLDIDVEKRQTRGISIKYDILDDELDEALLEFQSNEQHANSPDEMQWLAEPEVCLSVDSTHSFSPYHGVENDQAHSSTNFQANPECFPHTHDNHELISGNTNLVMIEKDSVKSYLNETRNDNILENKVICDLQSSQQQRDFRENDCCNMLSVTESERDSLKHSNSQRLEMDKEENYSPHGSKTAAMYSAMSINEPNLPYQRDVSAFDCVVSSSQETPHLHLSRTHHCSPEICVNNQLCDLYTHPSNANETSRHSSLHTHMTQPHHEPSLSMHQHSYIYHRYNLPYSSYKDNPVYSSYDGYHLVHNIVKDLNKNN